MHLPSTVFLVAVSAASAAAQSLTVDFPDSVLGAPAGQYPIYTGGSTAAVRGQSFCPPTFANLPTVPMICTRAGVQLAEVTGPVQYTVFQLRFGSSPVSALTSTWSTNLPDQRIQLDLSNQTLHGGANANIWVEYPLAFPFYWQPGQGVTLDITSQTGGQYLRTAIGTGVSRLIATPYTGAPSGSVVASGGIKFRMVFEPVGLTQWGSGCPGLNNLTPVIGSTGQSNVGSFNFLVTLSNAFGGAPGAFLLGNHAEFDIGGGCHVYNDLTFSLFMTITGAGPGNGIAAMPVIIPNNPVLAGFVADVQWGILDPGALSFVGVVTSAGGKVVVY
jgi:hypothetical protein